MNHKELRYQFDEAFELLVRQHLSKMGLSQEDSSGIISCFQDTGYACKSLADAIQKSLPETKFYPNNGMLRAFVEDKPGDPPNDVISKRDDFRQRQNHFHREIISLVDPSYD